MSVFYMCSKLSTHPGFSNFYGFYCINWDNEKSWKRQAYHWSSIQQELIEKFGEEYERYLFE